MESLSVLMANSTKAEDGNSSTANSTILLPGNFGSSSPENIQASAVLIYLSYICLPLYLLVGLTGNVLTIIVSTKKAFGSTFHGVLIMAMAVTDITCLLAVPFNNRFIQEMFAQDVLALSAIGCSTYYTFYRATKICSAILVVLVCLERFMLLWFPLKARLVSSRRVAVISVCCIFVSCLIFCGLWATLAGVKGSKCVPVVFTAENKSLAQACSAVGMTLHSFIPSVILLLFTPLTVAKLFVQREKRLQMSSGAGKKISPSGDETFRATTMLLSVVLAHLIFVTPFCVNKHVLAIQGTDIATLNKLWARNLHEITEISVETNCVINFFLYVLLNASFRAHLKSFFSLQRSNTGATK